MKKIAFLLILFVNIFFSSCKNNNNYDKEYSAALPGFVTYQEKDYYFTEKKLEYLGKTKIGWVINYEDYEKWRTMDNDDSLYYSVCNKNTIYRYSLDPLLKNRFELYKIEGRDDYLAIGDNKMYYYYSLERYF